MSVINYSRLLSRLQTTVYTLSYGSFRLRHYSYGTWYIGINTLIHWNIRLFHARLKQEALHSTLHPISLHFPVNHTAKYLQTDKRKAHSACLQNRTRKVFLCYVSLNNSVWVFYKFRVRRLGILQSKGRTA